jgi:Tol biopolymer transport system component
MTLTAGARLGRYEIRSLLGVGGMGEVYRAHDPKIGREVAIKVLPAALSTDDERLRRFEQEASAAGALNHPNILSIYDVETHDGSPYVVSELLEGQTLRELLSGGAPLAVRKALDYALQTARGLAAAHERGIIHRDMKPENIFVTADGRAKILDFGLAKLVEPDGDGARTDIPTRKVNTDSGAVMGTVGYMSPEQLRGRPVDPRTDIFSFGAVLYEMLSGRRAFQRDTAADTISAILREDPPELSETNGQINPALDRVVRRCLEKNREERFHSASDLAFALDALSGAQTSGATGAVANAATLKVEPRGAVGGRLGWVVAAVLLASTVALAALYFRRAAPPVETMRFTLPVPEKASYGGALALAPDGRRIVYAVNTGTGVASLWMRDLASVETRELPGTEGAFLPFWSPDSRHVGFFAGNRLKKIDTAGGPPQTLAEATADARGGTWAPDGTIVFSPNFTTPLVKVSAAGGPVTPATQLDEARGHTSHRWPWFLPDGRRFLFFVRLGLKEKDPEGVYVGSLDSPDVKFVLPTNLLAAFAPSAPGASSGHLLLMRDKTLVAQPFDAERLQLSGEPAVVAEGVLSIPGEGGPTGYAAFSASANGHLAYLSGDAALTQMGWFDRSGNPVGTLTPQGTQGEPWPSPDGKRVAISRTDKQPADIWLVDVARGTPTRHTFDPASDSCPLWTPDGERILFSSNRVDNKQQIYQKAASGVGSEEPFLTTDHNTYADSFTRDGRFLLYETEDPSTRFDLFVLPLTGERKPFPFLRTEFNETHAQFSPAGRLVAYVSDESGRAEVYVQTFPASGGKWQVSTGGGDQPQWRGDGRELFYVAPDKKIMAVPVTTAGSFEAGAPAPLFTTRVPPTGLTGDRNHFIVSPDGQRFLVNNLVAEGNSQPITLVLNWAAALKK